MEHNVNSQVHLSCWNASQTLYLFYFLFLQRSSCTVAHVCSRKNPIQCRKVSISCQKNNLVPKKINLVPKSFNLLTKKFNLVPKSFNLLLKEKEKKRPKKIRDSAEKIFKITNRIDWILSKSVCDVIVNRKTFIP